MMKRGAPPDKVGVLYRLLPIEFHFFTSRINSKGYHSLVPGLISCFRHGMGPFNDANMSSELIEGKSTWFQIKAPKRILNCLFTLNLNLIPKLITSLNLRLILIKKHNTYHFHSFPFLLTMV